MCEKEVADLIEPIEEPMWCYCSGGRSNGKSYFAEVLSSKDEEIKVLKRKLNQINSYIKEERLKQSLEKGHTEKDQIDYIRINGTHILKDIIGSDKE